MPVFQDKFFLWGLSIFFGSLAGHSTLNTSIESSLGLLLSLSFLLLFLALKSRVPLMSMCFVCGFLFLVGFCRTINWNQRTPNIVNILSNIEDYRYQDELVGIAQIQGLKWGAPLYFV